ncbi:MAG: tetratricopeptide repeat protein [Flavobacteriales bacterium]|jgi:serine phosphatase RsbU (regulator of sigma subunit)|nr:tetratricopeptide repeat protein [Flavobacteriales bacterium]
MRKLFIIAFILSFFLSINAQEKQFADPSFYLIDSLVLEELPETNRKLIDSCLTLYHETKEDSLKWRYLNTIAENTYTDIWYSYQKLASKISKKKITENLSELERKTFLHYYSTDINNEAFWHSEKSQLQTAEKLYKTAIELHTNIKDSSNLAITLNNLASNYKQQGKTQKAIETYEKSIFIAKQCNSSSTGQIISSLAKTYDGLGRKKEAIKLLNEALSYIDQTKSLANKAQILENIGYLLSKESDTNFQQALDYYKKSLAINKQLNYKLKIASNQFRIGELYFNIDQLDLAAPYFKKAINLNYTINNYTGLSNTYLYVAKSFQKQNKQDSALRNSILSYNFAQQSSSPSLIKNSAKLLSQIYAGKEQYRKAYYYQFEFQKMKDSINDKETNFALAKTEAKLQYEKEKELAAIEHNNELALKQKENEKQTLYKKFFIVGSIILLLIILFILKQFSKSIKQKKTIELSNIQLAEQHKEITSSITYAKRIQSAILPPNEIIEANFSNSFLIYIPKDIVSGDFYWLEQKDDNVYFAVADCTGHGVPGAMVSVICNNGLNRSVREHQLNLPHKILDKTREIVIQEFEKSGEHIKDGMDISLIVWNKKTNTILFSGAHNPLWIIKTQQSEPELIELKGDKQPIGNFERSFPFSMQEYPIEKGDILYLSSDGYADQFGGERNKKIKNNNFKKLLLKNCHLPMSEQQLILEQFFEDWKGDHEQLDDVCVTGIKF